MSSPEYGAFVLILSIPVIMAGALLSKLSKKPPYQGWRDEWEEIDPQEEEDLEDEQDLQDIMDILFLDEEE